MTGLTHEHATAECFAMADRIGKELARLLVETIALHAVEPNLIDGLIDLALDDFRVALANGGADQSDTDVMAQRVRLALVGESARLSKLMTWEEGHA